MAQKSTSERKEVMCSKEPPQKWDGSPARLFLAHFTETVGNIVKVKLEIVTSDTSTVLLPDDHVAAQIETPITSIGVHLVQGISMLIQCSAELLLLILVGNRSSHIVTSKCKFSVSTPATPYHVIPSFEVVL